MRPSCCNPAQNPWSSRNTSVAFFSRPRTTTPQPMNSPASAMRSSSWVQSVNIRDTRPAGPERSARALRLLWRVRTVGGGRADEGGDGMRQDIEFDAEGATLRGWFYVPDDAEGELPCVVMSHGFSAIKEMHLDDYAEVFCD